MSGGLVAADSLPTTISNNNNCIKRADIDRVFFGGTKLVGMTLF